MNRKPPARALAVRRAAALAWGSVAALLILFEAQHCAGVQHFAALPCVALLLALVVASLTAFVLALVEATRRERQGRTILLGLLALAPMAFLGWCGAYAAGAWQRRQVPRDLPMGVAKCLGASLMEAELALRPFERVVRRRFVLFHTGLQNPAATADAMDAYLDELERRYGKAIRQPIHWVRGGLLGQGDLSYYGLALTNPAFFPDGAPGISQNDRHEVAHALMSQWMPPDVDPPTLLSEGWAEANALPERVQAARQYQYNRSLPDFPARGRALATLLDADHYHQDSGYVYVVGYALTLHLIETYGPERFLKLYATIRPGDPEAAFLNVYGKGLDAIETEMTDRMDRYTTLLERERRRLPTPAPR